jgi:hypothetical protein
MMATADLIGHQLDPGLDFSGPVIGMCAAVERLLHESVISPVVGNDVARQKQTRTFGAILDTLEVACHSQGNQLHRDLKAYLTDNGIDPNDVLMLMQPWRKLNTSYRVPAAHRQLLSKASWQQLYRMLVGSEKLFIQTFDALRPPDQPAGETGSGPTK